MSWDSYERAAEKGPLQIALRVIILGAIIAAVIGGLSYGFGWCGEAAQVAKEEFGPRASLRKYEWFKDASQVLQKKERDVAIAEAKCQALEASYAGVPRGQWPRSDREQYNVWASELAGIKASYNGLVAEYNAASSKFNWEFAKSGEDLPPQRFVEK
jgi:hypothetical protein